MHYFTWVYINYYIQHGIRLYYFDVVFLNRCIMSHECLINIKKKTVENYKRSYIY